MACSRYIQLIYVLLTVTLNGMQQIHPVIYLLLTVTLNDMQEIHPVIYLLLTVTLNDMQQIHPVIYLLFLSSVTIDVCLLIHQVSISHTATHHSL